MKNITLTCYLFLYLSSSSAYSILQNISVSAQLGQVSYQAWEFPPELPMMPLQITISSDITDHATPPLPVTYLSALKNRLPLTYLAVEKSSIIRTSYKLTSSDLKARILPKLIDMVKRCSKFAVPEDNYFLATVIYPGIHKMKHEDHSLYSIRAEKSANSMLTALKYENSCKIEKPFWSIEREQVFRDNLANMLKMPINLYNNSIHSIDTYSVLHNFFFAAGGAWHKAVEEIIAETINDIAANATLPLEFFQEDKGAFYSTFLDFIQQIGNEGKVPSVLFSELSKFCMDSSIDMKEVLLKPFDAYQCAKKQKLNFIVLQSDNQKRVFSVYK